MMSKHSNISCAETLPLLILLTLSLLLGFLTIHDYGESWDEYNFYRYGEESLSAYPGIFLPDFQLEFHDPTLRYYGPWLLMLIVQVAKLFPNWLVSDVGHLITFLIFQLGIVLFYLLARRWLSRWSAFGATLLLATQPLLWGHAFINSRDIPFMVGFIAIIYFGLRMGDSLSSPPEKSPKVDVNPILKADWQTLPKRMRILLPMLSFVGIIALAGFAIFLSKYWLDAGLPRTDTTSARELDLYLRPLLATFWAAMSFFALSLLLLAGLYLPFMPSLRTYLWDVELRPIGEFLRETLSNKKLLLASLALGLTVAIRIMGFTAAGVVGAIILIRQGTKRIPTLLVYLLLTLPIIYILWPYLWAEPILRLAITLKVMLNFPWPGQVLFDGKFYAANELPWNYLPKLFSIQLTEPFLFLIFLGFGFLILKSFSRGKGFSPSLKERLKSLLQSNLGEFLLLLAFWFFLPFFAAIFSDAYFYDNFRQFLFILPPLFLLAGWGFEFIFARIKMPALRVALLVLAILPGIWAGIKLHPYEYIYYNQFIGGTRGAFRRYEMDYWGTAFRETANFVNETLPEDAEIVVFGPPTVLWRYARPDLQIYDSRLENLPTENFYAVISSRANNDLLLYPDIAPIYRLEKEGAVLAVVKEIRQSPSQ